MSTFSEPYEEHISQLQAEVKKLREENTSLRKRLRELDSNFRRGEEADAHRVDYWNEPDRW